MKQLTQEQLEQVYREHPEWISPLEVGKWYRYGSRLLCYVGLDCGIIRAYGFDEYMEWVDEGYFGVSPEEWNPAHPEEVEAALIAEAKRRYKVGDKLSNVFDDFNLWERVFSENLHFRKSDYSLWTLYDGGTYCNSCISCIFKDGKWATVVAPENDIHADIKALKDKYPNYNWTIIAEEKQ